MSRILDTVSVGKAYLFRCEIANSEALYIARVQEIHDWGLQANHIIRVFSTGPLEKFMAGTFDTDGFGGAELGPYPGDIMVRWPEATIKEIADWPYPIPGGYNV
jgi:hypothetical protein